MNVCLYGASSPEIAQVYIDAAEALGERLAQAGHTMVYGAGGAGVMGAAARGAKRGGGRVIGVVPRFLQVDGILFDGCDETVYTENMRERKQIMEERSDAFIVAPGGIGTYEEFFEIYTLKQLGRHAKPIVLFNTAGYYDGVLSTLRHTVEQHFMQPASLALIRVADTPDEVLTQIGLRENAADIRATKFV